MLIASLSLVAFPFMTGFYSKDFIIESTYGQFCFSSTVVYFISYCRDEVYHCTRKAELTICRFNDEIFMTGFHSKDFIIESTYGQFCFSSTVVYFISTIGAMFTT